MPPGHTIRVWLDSREVLDSEGAERVFFSSISRSTPTANAEDLRRSEGT
jgi:hypothetical protein